MISPSKQAGDTAGVALLRSRPQEADCLHRTLKQGSAKQVSRALQVVCDLGAADHFRDDILTACDHANARIRSKALLALAEVLANAGAHHAGEVRLEAALGDLDSRVRCNAVEAIERLARRELAPLLEGRAHSGIARERANVIKAMASLRLGDPAPGLRAMLRDRRDGHRLSGLWAVEQTQCWELADDVARIARDDTNVRVRGGAAQAMQRFVRHLRIGVATSTPQIARAA